MSIETRRALSVYASLVLAGLAVSFYVWCHYYAPPEIQGRTEKVNFTKLLGAQVWVGTQAGVIRFSKDDDLTKKPFCQDLDVLDVESVGGSVILATINGLFEARDIETCPSYDSYFDGSSVAVLGVCGDYLWAVVPRSERRGAEGRGLAAGLYLREIGPPGGEWDEFARFSGIGIKTLLCLGGNEVLVASTSGAYSVALTGESMLLDDLIHGGPVEAIFPFDPYYWVIPSSRSPAVQVNTSTSRATEHRFNLYEWTTSPELKDGGDSEVYFATSKGVLTLKNQQPTIYWQSDSGEEVRDVEVDGKYLYILEKKLLRLDLAASKSDNMPDIETVIREFQGPQAWRIERIEANLVWLLDAGDTLSIYAIERECPWLITVLLLFPLVITLGTSRVVVSVLTHEKNGALPSSLGFIPLIADLPPVRIFLLSPYRRRLRADTSDVVLLTPHGRSLKEFWKEEMGGKWSKVPVWVDSDGEEDVETLCWRQLRVEGGIKDRSIVSDWLTEGAIVPVLPANGSGEEPTSGGVRVASSQEGSDN